MAGGRNEPNHHYLTYFSSRLVLHLAIHYRDYSTLGGGGWGQRWALKGLEREREGRGGGGEEVRETKRDG